MTVQRSSVADPSRDAVAHRATAEAEAAAAVGGISVRQLSRMPEFLSVHELFESIWQSDGKNPPMSAELLRAMAKAGSYVSGAFDGDTLVGACVGFFHPPVERSLHSHIAGVASGMRGRNVGFALKLHQRAWALALGVVEISWTFDPLVRRNAYFNLAKLGVDAAEYLPDFYGQMNDVINGNDETDRVLVRWELAGEKASRAGSGRPVRLSAQRYLAAGAQVAVDEGSDGPLVTDIDCAARFLLVRVPADIEALRLADPDAARRWRSAVRAGLGEPMQQGAQVVGFDPAGWYVIDREPAR